MSWSVSLNAPAADAKKAIKDGTLPDGIKDYIIAGIDALVQSHGEDVVVAVSGSGHLHSGEDGDLDTTSASLNVYKAPSA